MGTTKPIGLVETSLFGCEMIAPLFKEADIVEVCFVVELDAD